MSFARPSSVRVNPQFVFTVCAFWFMTTAFFLGGWVRGFDLFNADSSGMIASSIVVTFIGIILYLVIQFSNHVSKEMGTPAYLIDFVGIGVFMVLDFFLGCMIHLIAHQF